MVNLPSYAASNPSYPILSIVPITLVPDEKTSALCS
jgi:hypothetical protein